MDKVNIHGLMAEYIKVHGNKTKCMEKENFTGLMEENI